MPVFGGKDGIDNVTVNFDRNPPNYTAGEILTGNVHVLCDDTTPVKGIRVRYLWTCIHSDISETTQLNLVGQLTIYWKKVEGGNTTEFAEFEDYIDESITVWTPNPRKREEQWIYPGVHE